MIIRLSKNSVVDLKRVVSYGFVFFGDSSTCGEESTNVIFNYDEDELDFSVECSDNKDAFIKLNEDQYEKLNSMFMSMLARGAHFFDAYSFVKDMLTENIEK